MTALLLWPAVVLVLGILTLLAVHELAVRYFHEKREERVGLTQRAEMEAKLRLMQTAVEELRDSVNRLEMAKGLE